MSETSFATTRFDLQDTPPPMSLLEIRLRDLLRSIRQQARTALSIERSIHIPNIIEKHTPLRISFDDGNDPIIPAAYIIHIDPNNGNSLFFMLPKDWTGMGARGNMSIERAIILLETVHHTMLHPTPPLLRFGDQIAPLPGENLHDFDLGTEEEPTLPARFFTTIKQ